MKRLREENLNTPRYFDELWGLPGIHRYDVERLVEVLKLFRPGTRMCDVGCGWYGFAQFLLGRSRLGAFSSDVVGVDFSKQALERSRRDVPNFLNVVQGSALSLPFRDCEFDFVVSGELIEHMEKPTDLVKELMRVCQTGGICTITTLDTSCNEAIAHGPYHEHLWEFTPEDLLEMFGKYGETTHQLVGNYHMIRCFKTMWCSDDHSRL